MTRGLTEQERIQKVLQEAAKHLGVSTEDLGVTAEELTSNMTVADQVGEAQAVLYYMEYKNQFTVKKCVNCNREFAYAWDRTSITCCSVECISAQLEAKGLSWKINRPLHLRWGRTAPMVVPPDVKSLADSLLEGALDSLVGHALDKENEEAVSELD